MIRRIPSRVRIVAAALLLLFAVVDAPSQTAWRQLPTPSGGTAYRLVQTPSGTIFAATPSGLLRSSDDGRTWSSSAEGLPRHEYPQLLPMRDGTLLLAVLASDLGAIFRSTDDGRTWGDITAAIGDGFAPSWFPLALDSATGDVHVIGARDLHRSSDNGATWTWTGVRLGGGQLQSRAGDLYYADGDVIVRLDGDDALDSTRIRLPVGVRLTSFLLVGADIIAYVLDPTGPRHYRTSDDGRTWATADPGAGLVYAMRHDGRGALHGFGERLFESLDTGRTWSTIGTTESGDLFTDHLVTHRGTRLATTMLGILRSENGGEWIASDSGLAARRIDQLAVAPDGALYALWIRNPYAPDFYRHSVSDDRGATWRTVSSRLFAAGLQRPVFFDAEGRLFAVGGYGLCRSSDVGATWDSLGFVPADDYVFGHAVRPGEMVVVDGKGRLFRTADAGSTWTPVGAPPGTPTSPGSIAFAPDGALLRALDRIVWRSTDMGASWHRTGYAGEPGRLVAGRGAVYLVASDGVHRSSDGYEEWRTIHPGIGTGVSLTVSGGNLLIRSGDSLVASTDRGATWHAATGGLERQSITTVVGDGAGSFYVGTADGGIFVPSSPMSGIAGSVERARLHASIAPQPAAEAARLEYELPASARIRIAVVDVTGRVVADLLDARRDRGAHVESLALGALPAGAWFVRLTVDGTVHHLPIITAR